MSVDREFLLTGLFFITAAILTLFGQLSAAAAATPAPAIHGTSAAIVAALPGSVILYDQNSNNDAGGLSSQNFEAGLEAFDDQGADDFTVPAGHKWIVKEVDVTGSYGGGPAASENVFFYSDSGALPGTLVAECDALPGKDNGSGSFAIRIPKTCPVKLKHGHYWISVQANQDFGCCGQWYWSESTVVNGDMAAWQQPGDAWGTDCTVYQNMQTCWGAPRDFLFALKGKDKS